MRLLTGYLVVLFCTIGSPSWSVMAELIQPKSVYQAAYCAEYLRHYRSYEDDGVGEQITSAASAIIGGGDNIEFARLGIEDAQRQVLATSPLNEYAEEEVRASLRECSRVLHEAMARVDSACGYGRDTSSPEEVARYLERLGLPAPEAHQQNDIGLLTLGENDEKQSKAGWFQRMLSVLHYQS